MSWKSIVYDWGGANEALLVLLQPAAPATSWLAWLLSAVGSYWAAPLALSAMAWRLSRTHDLQRAGRIDCQIRGFVIAGVLALALAGLLKGVLDLPRPFSIPGMPVIPFGELPPTGSFPSGHSVYVALLAVTLWPLASPRARFGLVAVVIAVGWSRVALAVHFPADVIGGWMLGLGCAVLSRQVVVPRAGAIAAALRRPGYGWWTVGLGITALDLTVKAAVHIGFPIAVSIPVTDFFNLVHRWNTGAAFSLLADAGGWQRYFFIALALLVSGFLLWMLHRPLRRIEAAAYSLLLGGALGNAIDRAIRGHVVDYLDLHWGEHHWPAFNLADVALSAAAVMLIAAAGRPRETHVAEGPTVAGNQRNW